ncbi:hypothetical protein [Neobacillus bataviensis]|nr:hypothetical protein [Neobacillus bataviensis]
MAGRTVGNRDILNHSDDCTLLRIKESTLRKYALLLQEDLVQKL